MVVNSDGTTGIQRRWPYYESLQFIHEFMSVKNESGAEVGFAKVRSHSLSNTGSIFTAYSVSYAT